MGYALQRLAEEIRRLRLKRTRKPTRLLFGHGRASLGNFGRPDEAGI